MAVLLFLHIALMFAAIGLALGTSALLVLAARANRLIELGPVIAQLPITKLLPPLFITGGLAGLAAAVAFGYSLLAPWLVLAYVGFAVGIVLGAGVTGRLIAQLGQGGDPKRLGRAIQLDFVLNMTLYGLLIADMVFKPFS